MKKDKLRETDPATLEVAGRANNAIASWLGAKRQQIEIILGQIWRPKPLWRPKAVWDLFCGGMTLALSLPFEPGLCVANDLNGDIVNLARVMQHTELGPKFFTQMARTMPCEETCLGHCEWYRKHADDAAPKMVDFDRACHAFVAWWMGRSGTCGTRSDGGGLATRFTSGGGSVAKRFRTAVQSIPWWVYKLQGWQIKSEDGIALAAKIADEAGTVIYSDCPYLKEGNQYRIAFTPEQHVALAKALNRFEKARVVVSYYEHVDLDKLYPKKRWKRMRVDVRKNIVQSHGGRGAKGTTAAPEILLVNQDLF